MALVLSLAAAGVAQQSGAPAKLHVNQQRVWSTLEKLSEFGRPAGAGFEGGVTRLGFSLS